MNPRPPTSSTKVPSGSRMSMTTARAVPPEAPRNPYAKGRMLVGTSYKLSNKKYSPYQILQKINDNAYVVELPADIAISPTSNVDDLFEYYPPDKSSSHLPNSRASSFQAGETDARQLAKGVLNGLDPQKHNK